MPSSSDQVIELSVEETNALRAELGLPPLRGVAAGGGSSQASASSRGVAGPRSSGVGNGTGGDDEGAVLEMSVDESNALRMRLGLPPLRVGAAGAGAGASSAMVQHAPAINLGDDKALQDRIERARLKQLVEDGANERFASESLADAGVDANSWARQMLRQKKEQPQVATSTSAPGGSAATAADDLKSGPNEAKVSYTSEDVKDLSVAHRAADFERGATVTLTLQDASLLDTDVHNKVVGLAAQNADDEEEGGGGGGAALLESVNLADAQRRRDGLQAKRRLEMGAGRAGAYAGFDDDEFAELGGTQAPSRLARGGHQGEIAPGGTRSAGGPDRTKKTTRGITIGALVQDDEEEADASDLFAMHKGKAISLEPSRADLVASDFMTLEEDVTNRKDKKSKKKEPKFHKKDKKSSKKKTRKLRRHSDDDDDDDGDGVANLSSLRLAQVRSKGAVKGLLEELEETAVKESGTGVRKRRRDSDDEIEEEDGDGQRPVTSDGTQQRPLEKGVDSSAHPLDESRAKFDAIMAKGNERTKLAFAPQRPKNDNSVGGLDDEEPDDAFLNAALTRARRLNRLKELVASSGGAASSASPPAIAPSMSAAEAVAAAVLSSSTADLPDVATTDGGGGGTIDFVVDETTEFTRALQARLEQQQRDAAKRKPVAVVITTEAKAPSSAPINDTSQGEEKNAGGDDDVDMAELALEMKPDEGEEAGASAALEGTTGAAVQLGRGLGGVLGLLQQTGELTRKNAGKEELRGRAKDERHYEDYEALDLSQVVKIDDRTATDKDRDLASRQVKLEYRDEYGRLLTRKEAFRDLSKQFHGYGSGKRKTEKKLAQIAREQAEARQSQALGSLSALQKTAKATGKAYVVHKT